ncbi:MAG: hypothetical protein OEM95_07530 [Gammaproteobacteria bacterium]|nr:hypothetical protein [Gammaproteobacteria bacterium]
MLYHEEKQYLVWLTAEKFEGWGAIVDLGPWLGSSSAALAEGLKRRSRPDKVHSFDLFKWALSYMEESAHVDLNDGEDFLPLFIREIGDYAERIEPRREDLMRYRWDSGPIEILFVDAAKTWELTNAILRGFGDNLIPGQSRVVLQDFRFHRTHWLPLIFDSRPDLWQEIESVEDGTTVTFMPLKPLHELVGMNPEYSEETFPLRSAEHLLRSRMAKETPWNRHLFLRTLYKKCLIEGAVDKTQAVSEELLADGVRSLTKDEIAIIEDIEMILVPQGWKAHLREDYVTARTLAERCFTASGKRPVYAVALLGISLLRLGDLKGAKSCIDEVFIRLPGFLHAKLYRAELALAEGRHHEAEEEALQVLNDSRGDEPTIEYSLMVLENAWDTDGRVEHAVEVLTNLVEILGESPTFLAHLAREQFKLGLRAEATRNIAKALNLAPGHKLAEKLRAEWSIDFLTPTTNMPVCEK